MIVKLAWRNIWRNRRRTYITMASIVFAVVLAILLNSLKEGILFRMQENVVSVYTGAIQVHKKGYWDEQTLDNTMAHDSTAMNTLRKHPSVLELAGRLESFMLAASGKHTKACMVVGIEPGQESSVTALDKKVVSGTYIHENDEGVMISEGLAEYLKLAVGDTLVLIGQGYRGVSAAAKYPVKALVRFASPELNRRMVYLPLQQAQYLFGAPGRMTALVLNIVNINHADRVEWELRQTLDTRYEVMGWKTLMPALHQVIEGERAENVIFLFVLYVLIAFGIFGTVLMMTLERQYEFGVLVAIGMKRLRLSSVVVLENILISILGAFVGTALSIPVVGYFYKFPIHITGELKETYEKFGFEPIFYFSVEPWIFYSQAIVVLGIALVLSIFPVFKIGRLEPVRAMRD